MGRYELLLFLHVASVIVWLGAGTTLALAAVFARRSGDSRLQRDIVRLGEWLGPRVFGPSSLGALVVGLLLVWDGHWTFGPLWIKLGLAAFAATTVTNAVFRLRTLRRLERAPADADGAYRRLARIARLDLTILFLAVADMIAKPSGSDTWTLAAGGAILVLIPLASLRKVPLGEPQS
jgi:uncharacterized membrane protein